MNSPATSRHALGAQAENAVGAYFEAMGYRTVAQNWRPGGARARVRFELDRVFVREAELLIVEVRARSSRTTAEQGTNLDAWFPLHKRRMLGLAVRAYLQSDAAAQAIAHGIDSVVCELVLVDWQLQRMQRIPLHLGDGSWS